ncbi:general odorant-binding protein 19d [Drosophila bipectinata]|uniref:general odorant-binding protein 19d n=1 Tax=Drosophila bipectinata TaxID=42026 RepID=UPI001C8B0496|nr:general odorant-binding protein 19d [Drosophila bipectinata]
MPRLVSASSVLLLVLACLVLGSGSASAKPHEEMTQEHATKLAHDCQAETGASDEDVEQLMKHEKAESHEAKCLRACVLKKFEILDDAGKLSKKHTVEMIKAMTEHEEEKAEVVEEVAEHCEAIEVPEDHCDAADTYQNCIYEQLKEHGIDLKH